MEALAPQSGAVLDAGALTFIDNRVDPATGTIQLKARFPNRDAVLWPGQYLNVVLTLTTEPGRVSAPRLFLAANGFTAGLGVLRDRVFPLLTFASLTRPMHDHEADSLGGDREWGLVSEMPMGTTVRRLRDGRLLIRNTVRYRPSFGAAAALLGGITYYSAELGLDWPIVVCEWLGILVAFTLRAVGTWRRWVMPRRQELSQRLQTWRRGRQSGTQAPRQAR